MAGGKALSGTARHVVVWAGIVLIALVLVLVALVGVGWFMGVDQSTTVERDVGLGTFLR